LPARAGANRRLRAACKTRYIPLTLAGCLTTQRPYQYRDRKGDGLDINVRKRGQVHVVQLRGTLRMGPAVDGLRQVLEENMGSGDTRFVLNLAEISMIDSTGIGLLVRFLASVKQRGGNIKLVQPSKFAVQTLRLVGVLNLFEVFASDDAAVESFA
jgi:anti-sigma B factor antagonist